MGEDEEVAEFVYSVSFLCDLSKPIREASPLGLTSASPSQPNLSLTQRLQPKGSGQGEAKKRLNLPLQRGPLETRCWDNSEGKRRGRCGREDEGERICHKSLTSCRLYELIYRHWICGMSTCQWCLSWQRQCLRGMAKFRQQYCFE